MTINTYSSVEDFEKRLRSLVKSEEFSILEAISSTQNVLTIVGSTYRERWFSAFIAWLINPEQSHGLGSFPLKEFLSLCYFRVKSLKIDSRLPDYSKIMELDFPSNSIYPDPNFEGKEYSLGSGKSKCSFDVTLMAAIDRPGGNNGSLLLVIENKIRSSEGSEQTEKYANLMFQGNEQQDESLKFHQPNNPNTPQQRWTYRCPVFLTPNGQEPLDKRFIPVDYQLLYDELLHPCLTNKNLTSQGKNLIEEFIATLAKNGYCLPKPAFIAAENLIEKYQWSLDILRKLKRTTQDQQSQQNFRVNLTEAINHLLENRQFEEAAVCESNIIYKRGSVKAGLNLIREHSRWLFSVEGDPDRTFESPSELGRHLVEGPCNGWKQIEITLNKEKICLNDLRTAVVDQKSELFEAANEFTNGVKPLIDITWKKHLDTLELINNVIDIIDSESSQN